MWRPVSVCVCVCVGVGGWVYAHTHTHMYMGRYVGAAMTDMMCMHMLLGALNMLLYTLFISCLYRHVGDSHD